VAGPSVLTLPNLLTLLRIALAPVFLWLYVAGDTRRALAVFAAAAATDLLDGIAARALHQYSRLGAFLDPIADKFLLACGLFALAARGQIPWWLPALVVARDVAILAAAAWLSSTHRAVPVAPTRIGKYATFTLVALVVVALAGEFQALGGSALTPFVAALGLLAAECVAVSWIQYFLYFIRSARMPPRVEADAR
jgi:cardiolipin synthase